MYNIIECNKAIQALQNISTTVQVKAQHKSKVWELSDILNEIASTSYQMDLLYSPRFNGVYAHYESCVNYRYNELTKNRLDNTLKTTIKTIIADITDCIKMEDTAQGESL